MEHGAPILGPTDHANGDQQAGKEEQSDTPPRSILYHGTSTYRLKAIQRDNRLPVSPTGDPKIALTTERSVAEYFACNAAMGDHRNHPEEESHPVLLVLDGELPAGPPNTTSKAFLTRSGVMADVTGKTRWLAGSI
jgi:hypothetical protein